MAHAPHPFLGILVALSLAAHGLAVIASTEGSRAGETVAISASSPSHLRTAIAERTPRPAPALVSGLAVVTTALPLLALTALGLIGQSHRRVGDDGDQWRALLLGAPPAAA